VSYSCKFLTFVLLIVIVVLSGHNVAFADDPKPAAPAADMQAESAPGSKICELVAQDNTFSNEAETECGQNGGKALQEEITIPISENFNKVYIGTEKKESASCGKIFNCLRYGAEKKVSFCEALFTLKNAYPNCVVTGRTGIDLLQNYVSKIYVWAAGLVGVICVLIILISDLFDVPEAILKGLKHLRYRRHEVIVWNLWDRAELTLPFSGPTMFDGLESTGRLLTDPRSLRARYVEEVERFQAQLRTGCGHMLIDYTVFSTAMALDVALSGYLATRAARLRQHSSRVLGGG
jgi:hypothetical protein